jgi:hypothetical protein
MGDQQQLAFLDWPFVGFQYVKTELQIEFARAAAGFFSLGARRSHYTHLRDDFGPLAGLFEARFEHLGVDRLRGYLAG